MKSNRALKSAWYFVTPMILCAILLACSGCQTFRTKEEAARIEREGTADSDIGNALDFLGAILGPAALAGGHALAK